MIQNSGNMIFQMQVQKPTEVNLINTLKLKLAKG